MAEDNTVTVGEVTVQFSADGRAAEAELEEFRNDLLESVSELEEANAVIESFVMPDFDERLSWGDEQ